MTLKGYLYGVHVKSHMNPFDPSMLRAMMLLSYPHHSQCREPEWCERFSLSSDVSFWELGAQTHHNARHAGFQYPPSVISVTHEK